MSRYGVRKYNDPGFVYGDSSGFSSLSVAPFTATAVDYDRVNLSWLAPTGSYNRIRVVRNQNGVSDTAEDGIILLDESFPATVRQTRVFTDAVDTVAASVNFVNLVPGQYAYYSIWLWLTTDNVWYQAGTAQTLIANRHETMLSAYDGAPTSAGRTRSTHEKVMDLLPRVFTSSTMNAVDEVDPNSALYNFLYGFSYTVDEFLTFIDLLAPNADMTNLPPTLLAAKSAELALTTDNRASTRFQRQLVREARWMYARKGTPAALADFVESMTGYNTTIIPSPNLLLSNQDSTFYDWQSYGDWLTANSATITGIPTYDGNHVTYNAVNTFTVGEVITITGITPVQYNAVNAVVTAATTAHFTIESSAIGGYTSGGIAQKATASTHTFWNTIGNVSMTSCNTVTPPAVEVRAIDQSQTVKVVVSSANAKIALGEDFPITRGIPVQPSTLYSLAFYQQGTTTTHITPNINWYDVYGAFISTSAGTAAFASASFGRTILSATSPANAAYAGFDLVFDATGTFYLDMFQLSQAYSVTAASGVAGPSVTYTITGPSNFVVGRMVSISGLGTASGSSLNLSNVQVTGVTPTTVTVASSTVGVSSGTGVITASFHEAGGVNVYIQPNKTNMLTNPSFEAGTAGTRTNLVSNPIPASTTSWTGGGAAAVGTMSDSTACYEVTSNGSSTPYIFSTTAVPAANSGDTFIMSAMMEVIGDTGGTSYTVRSHGTTGNVYFASGSTAYLAGSALQRVTIVTTLNAAVAAGELNYTMVRSGGVPAAGIKVRMSKVIIEKVPTGTTVGQFLGYFDGSHAPAGYSAAWSGTANASTSIATNLTLTPNGWSYTGVSTALQSAITVGNPGPVNTSSGNSLLQIVPSGAGAATLTGTATPADVVQGAFHTFSVYGRAPGTAADVTLGLSASASGATTISNSQTFSSNGAITGATSDGAHISYATNFPVAVGDIVSVTGITPAALNISNAVVTSTSGLGFSVASPGTGTYVSGGTVNFPLANRLVDGWSRFSVTIYVPLGYSANPITLTPTVSYSGGATTLWDAAQLEPFFNPTDYFDGSYVDAAWGQGLANANNSDSFMYQNWTAKIPRLADEIDSFLPSGTAFTVLRVDGVATTVSGAAVRGITP